MHTTESLAETPPPGKRRRWLRWTIAGVTAAIAVLFLLYLRITAPVMSREEMQPHFDAAKKYLTGAAPERLALGERYLDILAQMRDAAGDVDEETLYTEEGAATREGLIASTRESLEKLRALSAEGPGAIEYREPGKEAYDGLLWRSCVMVLRSDVMQGVAAKDFVRVHDDLHAAFAAGETFEHRGAVVPRLVAGKVRADVCGQIVRLRTSLPEGSIREISRMLAGVEERIPPLQEFMWGEIDLARSMLVLSAPEKVPALINRSAVKGAGLVLQHLIELMTLAAKPTHEAMVELKQCERRLLQEQSGLIPWPWTQQCLIMLPASHAVYGRFVGTLATLRGTRLVLALELYARAKGAYPEKLGVLVPEYIEALPRDPFSGQDFGYMRRGDLYVLYSVGPNLKDDITGVAAELHVTGEDDMPWEILETRLDLVIFGTPEEEE